MTRDQIQMQNIYEETKCDPDKSEQTHAQRTKINGDYITDFVISI
jgi:hypothetical protein